jgi:hypothetical protein
VANSRVPRMSARDPRAENIRGAETSPVLGGVMSIRAGTLSGEALLEDDALIKLRGANVDLSTLTIGVGGELSGSGTAADPITNLGTIDASKSKLNLRGAVTGDGQLHIDNKATLELGALPKQQRLRVSTARFFWT